jgi:hypothetical protein
MYISIHHDLIPLLIAILLLLHYSITCYSLQFLKSLSTTNSFKTICFLSQLHWTESLYKINS